MFLAGIGGLGAPELMLILVIVIVLFGASRLGSLGRELGTGIKEFKKATQSEDDERRAEEERRQAADSARVVTTVTPATNGAHVVEQRPADQAPVVPPPASVRPPEYKG